jgi:cytochrome oxidase Cu insertion factor (SCO1/SenC/PrrC family)
MIGTTNRRSRREVTRGCAALLAALAGCASAGGPGDDSTETPAATTDREANTTASATGGETAAGAGWRATRLTDVLTGESFSVREFEGRPVVLEFFAVWCPVCTDQQRRLRTARDRLEDLVAVSLNVDPNEDSAAVRAHAREEGFDWRYAVAPTSMTEALVDEFGTVVTTPPAAPVVLICPDGSADLLEGRGVKSADAIEAAVDGC